MRSSYSIGSAVLFVAILAIDASQVSAANAARKPDSVREFESGSGWFTYDQPVDVALYVLNPSEPKCHEVGEIILLFETRDELLDKELIESAARTEMNRYIETCQSLGGKPSRQRTIVGIIAGEAQPDQRGRIIGDGRVLEAMVSSLTGDYNVRVRHNAVADGSLVAAPPIAPAENKLATGRNTVAVGEDRARYDAMLEASAANAQAPGIVEGLTGGSPAKLAGAWSGSPNDCAKERVIFYEKNNVATVEWWRAPNEKIGLLPWRTGKWELRGGTLIANFDYRVKYDHLRRKLREGATTETVQFELKEVNGSEFRLATVGGRFSPGRLFLGGAEKLFVRCLK